jgi:K+-sensing histidine kinase KdpD
MNIADNPLYLLPPLIASAISLVLVVLVLRNNIRSFVHRLFALMLTAAFCWGISIFMMRSSPDLETALVWSKLTNVFIPVVVVLMYRFTFTYTGIRPRRWTIRGIYLFLLVNIVLVPTNLLIADMQLKSYGYAPVTGPVFYPVAFIDYLLTILSLYNLVRAYRGATNYETRNRFLYVTIGLGIALLGGFGDVLPLLGVHLYPGAIFGHIFFYIMTAFAMVKYHLLDISIAIRKGLAYILMSAMIAVPYVVVIILLAQFFNGTQVQFWGYFIALIVLAVAMQPLWNRVQSWVDHWFYGSRYRNLQELIFFSRQHFSIRNMDEIAGRYMDITKKAMGAREAYLLVPDPMDNYRMTGASDDTKTGSVPIFNNSSPVISWFETNSQPVSISELLNIPQVQALTVTEEQIMKDIGANLFVPLKTQNNQLCGILILTEKISQRPYSGEERSLLMMIAGQISVGLDNIRLYRIEKEMHDELQKQNDQKTEFLHTVAHEMKTPLTSLLSSSELLEECIPGDNGDIVSRLVGNIKRSARSMNRRVTELVESASIQSSNIRLEAEPLSMNETVAEIASDMEYMFSGRNQTLDLHLSANKAEVYADRGRLEQIIFNLLSNASKFSPDNSEISIKVDEENGSAVVRVLDEAPVIPESERFRIFEPYYRGEDTVKLKEVPGLGIGLYVTRRLVEAHRGRVWIEENGAKGNIFAFSIPVIGS